MTVKVNTHTIKEAHWMNTPITGVHYWMEDGKYTIDGYDFFDTMEDLETNIYWTRLWIDGKAYREADGRWVLA